eukprot:TRINITY_DN54170_c0_g1_i1.p1 TRINITY_DN54170_c0_g1~~TRINITY_DN54170_c0_g1_i1.p1  ORF type:complete len:150 (+),score=26.06 TRINITY_DN54170_c0_g1_i1:278-727(+)
MSYYAQTSHASDHQVIEFENESYAKFVPVAKAINAHGTKYIARKKSPDEWERMNIVSDKETPEYIYTLVRIVNEDGSPTKFWSMFTEYMHNKTNFVNPFVGMKEMLVWNSNDDCMRKCEMGYLSRLAPCTFCAWKCSWKRFKQRNVQLA